MESADKDQANTNYNKHNNMIPTKKSKVPFLFIIGIIFFITSCVREKEIEEKNEPMKEVQQNSYFLRGAKDETESNIVFRLMHTSPTGILINCTRIVEGRPQLILGRDSAISLGVSSEEYDEYVEYLRTIE